MLQTGRGEELIKCWEDAEPTEKTDMVTAEEFRQETLEELSVDKSKVGEPFFLEHLKHRIREHELTVLGGINFSGKSQFISNQIAFDCGRGLKSGLASFEQRQSASLASIVTQLTSLPHIANHVNEFNEAYDMIGGNLSIYKRTDKPTVTHIIQEFTLQFRRKGTSVFYLDNLSTLKLDRGDNTAVSEAVNELREFVNKYPVHVFLIVHLRKPSREFEGKMAVRSEIKGAGELADLAHNVIIVHRYEQKDMTIQAMLKDKRHINEIEVFKAEEPDGKVAVLKNRFLGTTPSIDVWFDKDTQIFQEYYGRALALLLKAREANKKAELEDE